MPEDNTKYYSYNSQHHDIGWLMKSVESLNEKIDYINTHQSSCFKQLDDRLNKVEKSISLYQAAIKAVKLIGLTVVLLLTFKFGDIKNLWSPN